METEAKPSRGKRRYDADPEFWKKRSTAYYQENRETVLEKARTKYAAQPQMRKRGDPAKRTACNRRRYAGIGQAAPAWLTVEQREQMRKWYALGRAIGYHVDHIVPLRGENVCGLHVPWNLQTLHPVENLRKSNRYASGNNTHPS